jgi:hypothetical protein
MHRSDSRLIEWWKALRSQEPRQSVRQRHCLPHGGPQRRRIYFGDVVSSQRRFVDAAALSHGGHLSINPRRIRPRDRHWLDYERTAASVVELADADFRLTPLKQTCGERAGMSVQCQCQHS